MTLGLINANPVVQAKKERLTRTRDQYRDDGLLIFVSDIYSGILLSVFFLGVLYIPKYVRDIRDPEHPYTLEQLSVLSEDSITVDDKLDRILITFTPTIQHCSMANVIGLCLRAKLKECLPLHYKVDIRVSPGSHADEDSVNKQLNDKERVIAALENPNLRQLVDECIFSNEM
ncbi:hypothetical protein EUTSA_v10010765mg [Eutrema salsugineum]|uniref:MIP18 family-like domain-containing protein n=1 Tax=Eutrema salsugineum TaxID=72664 RepID=V4LNU4_EUTSA|nr:hypothetical protein EUTSA_v10010765mg [Eutrema salsugineum]